MEPEERRAQLLLAAREVFARKGYHRAGVSDVVEAVGVARGTFYNYFESKRAAFAAVVAEMVDEIVSVIVPIDVSADIPSQVRANLERVIRAVAAEDVVRVLFAEAVGIDDDGDEVLRAFYAEVLGHVERALRTGIALGVVREGDVRLRARCLLGLVKEPVVQAALSGERLDADALIAEVLSILLAGVLRGT